MVGVPSPGKHGKAAPLSAWWGWRVLALDSWKSSLAQAPCRTHSRATAACHECEDRVKPWHPCSQGPVRASVWAWREVPVMCLYPLDIRASFATCTWAVGR